MEGKFLSTGAFARLCKTTKATLFHYEKLGLLKPKNILENGYRCYGIEQFFDFETIAILKETGSSLEEILRMRDNIDEENLLKLLEEKKHILNTERRRLEIRETMLENILEDLREARNLELDQVVVLEMEEESLEITPVGGQNHDNLAESIIRYAAYVSSGDGNGIAHRSPFGIILDEAILNGASYHELFYFNRPSANTTGNLCKCAGKYAVIGHMGNFSSHMNCLKKMGKWCFTHNYKVCGRIYAYDLASSLRPKVIDNYLVKYVIPVTEFLS